MSKSKIMKREFIKKALLKKIESLDKNINGIGIQAIFISPTDDWVVSGSPYHPYQKIAKNDGLSPEDFMEWFTKGGYSGGIMALIHFTRFRY